MSTHSSHASFVSSPFSGWPSKLSDADNLTKSQIHARKLTAEIPMQNFQAAYLSATDRDNQSSWSKEQMVWVTQIKTIQQEILLYTQNAPLLRLLNSISKQVLDSLDSHGEKNMPALVFRSGHRVLIPNPYGKNLSPDIIVLREEAHVLEQLADSNAAADFSCSEPKWHNIVAVGEAKTTADEGGCSQLAKYIRSHLQWKPERNAVLGFTARAKGYRLFYHDANVIHYSQKSHWNFGPDPLYAFVRQLYKDPFGDPTIIMIDDKPAWATKIGEELCVSIDSKPEPGPGQRRFTTKMKVVRSETIFFVKDIWRSASRRFFEGLLYDKAHRGQILPGLMLVYLHGYVKDREGNCIRTTSLLDPSILSPRYKMRLVTQDVGRPLHEVKTLKELLCVMYDVCVVLRNLYVKSKILHRDISENNIMIAPNNEGFYKRCAGGYDGEKYINQVLSDDRNERPRPACLLVDLGNGADLDAAQREPDALAQRTGTPKFIARSVSSGKVLGYRQNYTGLTSMPELDGQALALYQGVYSPDRYDHFTNMVQPQLPNVVLPAISFTHRLFHDAESLFWVIAWLLACSASENDEQGTISGSNLLFTTFIEAMQRHYPANLDDSRSNILFETSAEWSQVLHPGLSSMADMLSSMSNYVRPEWAYRPELDPEHVHEALMRLLLTEIVRIDSTSAEVNLAFGKRPFPNMNKSPHTSNPPSTSQLSVPNSTNSNPSSSRKRRASEPATPVRRSPRLLQLELLDFDSLLVKVENIDWQGVECELQPPYDGTASVSGSGIDM